jgi:hypothetical protein
MSERTPAGVLWRLEARLRRRRRDKTGFDLAVTVRAYENALHGLGSVGVERLSSRHGYAE